MALLQIDLKKNENDKVGKKKLFTSFYLGIKIICESLQR